MHRALLVSLAIVGASLVACTGAVGDGEIGGGTDDHDAISGGDTLVGGGDSASHPTTDSGTSNGDTTPGADTTPPPPVDTGTPPPDDTGTVVVDTGPSDPVAAARVTCVDEINKYRATLSLPPY